MLGKPAILILSLILAGLAGLGIGFIIPHSNDSADHKSPPAKNSTDMVATQSMKSESVTSGVGSSSSQRNNLQRQIDGLADTLSSLVSEVENLKNMKYAADNSSGMNTELSGELESQQTVSGLHEGDQPTVLLFEEVSEYFVNEERDEEWAASVESSIQQEFATNKEISAVVVNEIQCRSAICRISFRYPEGLTNEEAFIMENEVIASFSEEGFNNVSSKAGSDGSSENLLWYLPPPENVRERK